MHYTELDTPSLLIDKTILIENIRRMQAYAEHWHVNLRPHTKTHKAPAIAKLQVAYGATGIAVAKVQEALVMAAHGLNNILIANQVIGVQKLEALADCETDIMFGIDSVEGIRQAETVFARKGKQANVLLEIEVGEQRTGLNHESELFVLLEELSDNPHVQLVGMYGHDGNTYSARDREHCAQIARRAQLKLLHFAQTAREKGFDIKHVSYGSTPPFLLEIPILEGITEIRPGTYVYMDASQSSVIGHLRSCAATVLSTVISLPTPERVALDVGAKGLTMQERSTGITAVNGKGLIYEQPEFHIVRMYDEHALVENRHFREQVVIGQKVRIIPVHICPVSNLFECAYLIENEQVVDLIDITARAKLG